MEGDRVDVLPATGEAKEDSTASPISRFLNEWNLRRAGRYSRWNRKAAHFSKRCACYYCQRVFPTNEITSWVDGGLTAVCPYCDVDSVIPSYSLTCGSVDQLLPESLRPNFSDVFLSAMHRKWFGSSITAKELKRLRNTWWWPLKTGIRRAIFQFRKRWMRTSSIYSPLHGPKKTHLGGKDDNSREPVLAEHPSRAM